MFVITLTTGSENAHALTPQTTRDMQHYLDVIHEAEAQIFTDI